MLSQIKALQAGESLAPKAEDLPRVYALQKYVISLVRPARDQSAHHSFRNFFQMRIDRQRQMEIAKRNQQRIKDPNFFPAAPRGDIA